MKKYSEYKKLFEIMTGYSFVDQYVMGIILIESHELVILL